MSPGGEAAAGRSVRIALCGDTMLGRKVAEALTAGTRPIVAPGVIEGLRTADLVVMNLECCISERGSRWPDPRKPFFFRAPPRAVDLLVELGVDLVTLANNHALDYGTDALFDTLDLLHDAGIATVGAGRDLLEARRPHVLRAATARVGVIGLADHPADFAAGPSTPGIAHADLRDATPNWVEDAISSVAIECDAVLVTPHWGPNMVTAPLPHVRRAAGDLVAAGATLVAGHSAHVFHGVSPPVLFDLGDFVDDYAIDPRLRNDLGLLWFAELDETGVSGIEALPLQLEFCHTRPADGPERRWIVDRLTQACADHDVEVVDRDDLVRLGWDR